MNSTTAPAAIGNRMKSWKAFTLLLALCYAMAGAGGIFLSSIPGELRKHGFRPSVWAFTPGWIAVYSCMGVSAWLIWRTPQSRRRSSALILFAIQLIINFTWMMDFFYYQVAGPSMFIMLMLWVAIAVTTFRFWKLNHLSAYLMGPYLAWIAFASLLNFDIATMN